MSALFFYIIRIAFSLEFIAALSTSCSDDSTVVSCRKELEYSDILQC